MGDINKDIGRRIRDIRDRAKLTQTSLGEILGVEKATVSKYESGETKVNPESLIKIAELGRASLDWLMTGKAYQPPAEQKQLITYPLAEEERNALVTAENLLRYRGLNDRYTVAEIGHQPPVEETNDEERRLLTAFRQLDRKIQEALLIQAEMTAEGLKKSAKKEPHGGGLMEAI